MTTTARKSSWWGLWLEQEAFGLDDFDFAQFDLVRVVA